MRYRQLSESEAKIRRAELPIGVGQQLRFTSTSPTVVSMDAGGALALLARQNCRHDDTGRRLDEFPVRAARIRT